jgi:hypothetical protein
LLPIGSRLRATALHRYKLRKSYWGCVDDAYEGPDGVTELFVGLDQKPTGSLPICDENTSSARVSKVSLQARTRDITARVDRRIRTSLGAPRVACYTDGYSRRIETRYWTGRNGRGIQMLVFHEQSPGARLRLERPYEPGASTITFGDRPITRELLADLGPCGG